MWLSHSKYGLLLCHLNAAFRLCLWCFRMYAHIFAITLNRESIFGRSLHNTTYTYTLYIIVKEAHICLLLFRNTLGSVYEQGKYRFWLQLAQFRKWSKMAYKCMKRDKNTILRHFLGCVCVCVPSSVHRSSDLFNAHIWS